MYLFRLTDVVTCNMQRGHVKLASIRDDIVWRAAGTDIDCDAVGHGCQRRVMKQHEPVRSPVFLKADTGIVVHPPLLPLCCYFPGRLSAPGHQPLNIIRGSQGDAGYTQTVARSGLEIQEG